MEITEELKNKYLDQIKTDERFKKYYELLLEYNQKYNLTAITEEKEVYFKHFLDSALGESLFPINASVAEIGSGAGFPSIVLKLLRDDLSFTLIESVGKKCSFLNVVIQELNLKNVVVLNGRAEDFAHKEEYREQFSCVTARAVARLNTLSEYCVPFIKKGGLFIAYKGGDEEELKESKKAFSLLGVKEKESIFYDLSSAYGKRSLIVCEKVKNTSEKYPRGNGKERKLPLI